MFSTILGLIGNTLSGSSPRFYVIAFLCVMVAGMFGYGYIRYTSLVNTTHEQELQIAKLNDDAKVAERAIQEAKQALKDVTEKYKKIRSINTDIQEKNKKYQRDLNRLNGILNKRGRDIGVLANEKPKLIENVVNGASKDRKRCLEVISGKPKLKGEKNEVCPNLFIK